jgi:hypothetical protein
MSSSKKVDLLRDFAAGVYQSVAQNPIPPPYTLYTCIQYTYSHREGGGGRGELNQREKKVRGATVNTAGSKIPT